MKKYIFIVLLFPLIFTWNCPASDGPETVIKKVDLVIIELGEGDITSEGEFGLDYTPQRTSYQKNVILDIDGVTLSQYLNRAGPGLNVSWLLNDINNSGVSCGASQEFYVLIIKQNGVKLTTSQYSVVYTYAGNHGDADFPLNLTDQTYATPETHTYTLEFWECNGACDFKEYRKKTKKKEEITITVNFTP